MKTYAKKERILSQPQIMLISSFTLQNGTLITPLLLIYLQLGLVFTRIHCFVEYTRRKCFNSFVQAAVDAGRKGDEKPSSSVVAETMKLLAVSFSGYQIMDRSGHTVTKHLSDEKTHACSNSKQFKKLDQVNNMKLNSPKHRLSTKSQSMSGSSFFITQNCERWRFTRTSSPYFVV